MEIGVYYDLYVVFALKVEEGFLLVAEDEHYLLDSGVTKLLYLTLDEHLVFDHEQSLGLFK